MLFHRKIRCSRKYWVLTNTSPLVLKIKTIENKLSMTDFQDFMEHYEVSLPWVSAVGAAADGSMKVACPIVALIGNRCDH